MTRRFPASARLSLDELYRGFEGRHDIADPIQRVRSFTDPRDREIVGLCAAALAFGRVASVLQSIDALLAVMGSSPAHFVRCFEPTAHRDTIGTMTHRWVRGPDILALVWIIRQMLERCGSVERFFSQGYQPDAEDVGEALESFSMRALAFNLDPVYGRRRRRGVTFFFPRPSKGSACKRLNLYLRWMVRRDQLDLGVWTAVSPAQLVVPLDTHIIRVGQCLRLTRYRSPGWAMAREITETLRRLDPVDPVKYDFSLCHLSMMNQCGFTESHGDGRCPLRGWCRPAPRRRRPSRRPSGRR